MPASRKHQTGVPGAAYYIIAFMALSTLAILAGMLGAWFWLSRPVNLGPETDRLADLAERILREQYVPAANISREPPVEASMDRGGRRTHWRAHRFAVTLPRELDASAFKEQLRKELSNHFVKLLDKERDPAAGRERVSLYTDDIPFAEITIVNSGRQAAEAHRSDLRNSSEMAANLVEDVLESLGSGAIYARGVTEDREDLGARWRYTAFQAELPPGLTIGELRARIEAANTLPGVAASTSPNLPEGVDILLTIAGKPCVGLACATSPAPARDSDDSGGAAALLGKGIAGSDPAEPESEAPDAETQPDYPEITPPMPPEARDPQPEPEPAPETEPDPGMEEDARAPDTPDEPAPPAPRSARQAPPLTGTAPARIAILIDDGGNNSTHTDRILALDNRLTLAILPNTPFGVETAERGAELGFEIMLHMPMETEGSNGRAAEGTIYTHMDDEEIQKLTRAALDQFPMATGANNHTGSRYTSDKAKMEVFLEVLRERGLFFVDSVTGSRTVAYETAVEMGIPAARRDVFLDNDTSEASVSAQFEELLRLARQRGYAIGIGHFQSPATATVLAREIPALKQANIELVHVSELLQ